MKKWLWDLEKTLTPAEILSLEKNACLFSKDVGKDTEVFCGFCGNAFLLQDYEECPHCKKDIIMGRFDW